MRWLANYLRQVFCSHEFQVEERRCVLKGYDNEVAQEGVKVSLLCTKCGYHRSFWKFV